MRGTGVLRQHCAERLSRPCCRATSRLEYIADRPGIMDCTPSTLHCDFPLREVAMPWLVTNLMIERLEIVQNAFSDCSTMADVCARYGARVALLTANGTHATRIGDDRRPLHEPRIQIRPRVKALAGERIAHHVLHAGFDFTYGLRPIRLACHGPHAKVATEVDLGRMPVDSLQRMHQHDRLRVVDEDRIGDATEVMEGLLVAGDPFA